MALSFDTLTSRFTDLISDMKHLEMNSERSKVPIPLFLCSGRTAMRIIRASFGAEITTYGEVVFDTAMAGYQEMLTDPSFAGQIVVPTYPLIGNYGINEADIESKRIQLRGFVVRHYCATPSHYSSIKSLDDYLSENNIPGLSDVDTRSLTRCLRSSGVMMGILTSEMTIAEAKDKLKELPDYDTVDYVKEVTTPRPYKWDLFKAEAKRSNHIVIIDMGLKYNIARLLTERGCDITIAPSSMTADEILKLKPDGILLSPGPGDPALLENMVDTVKKLVYKKPVMGICLGHQLISHALGAKTFKLKFGHRGGNHPVRDLETGKIHITTQNHGYAVDETTVRDGLVVSHINLNDGTVEGLQHKELAIISIQYHAEGSPGPRDNIYLFDRFLELVKNS